MLHQNSPKINPQHDAPSVKVIKLQARSKCSGSHKASADVEVGGLWAIFGLEVVQSRRSGIEVCWPTGHDHNYTVQPLNLTLKRSVENAVISAWQGAGGAQ